MQCGEGADEANCDGGGCGYVGSIGNIVLSVGAVLLSCAKKAQLSVTCAY